MYQKPQQVTSSVVYIGQIPYEWDEANLKSVISGTGKVVEVRLGFDFIGKNKGFCFIEYLNPNEAAKAIPILNSIKIVQPGSSQFKRLRVESSKESFKSNGPGNDAGMGGAKPVLTLDRSSMPNNVQFASEMNWNGGNDGRIGGSSIPPVPQIPQIPSVPSFAPKIPQLPTLPGVGPNQQMPVKFSTASKVLPVVAQMPFAVPDKINETLSKVPPAQLIELVATLKNILNGPEASRAFEVFQLSPDLATTVAQALLLMGFIDEDVISESMKAAQQATPTPPPQQQIPQHLPQIQQQQQQHMRTPPVPHPPTYQPQYNTNNGQPQYSNVGQPQFNKGPPQFSNIGQPQYNNNGGQQQYNNNGPNQYNGGQQYNNSGPSQYNNPGNGSGYGVAAPSKWPHLPPNTQQKLSGLPPDQAELIAQVLSLPADQISTLPPDKQSMVTNLRAQYL